MGLMNVADFRFAIAFFAVISLLFLVFLGQQQGEIKEFSQQKKTGAVNEKIDYKKTFFSETLFGLEEIGYNDIKDADAFFKRISARGVNVVGIDFLDIGDGTTIFPSLALKRMGFELEEGGAAKFLKILSAAKKHGVRIVFMLESLAHAKTGFLDSSEKINKEKITPKEVKAVIREIAAITREAGVQAAFNEESFEEPFIDAASNASSEYSIPYLHFFEDAACRPNMTLTEDYSYYPFDAFSDEKDLAYLEKNMESGAYYGQLGNNNLLFAFSNTCKKESGVLTAGGWGLGDATHQNIALLRYLLFDPKAYFFVLATHSDGGYSKKEKKFVEEYDFEKLKSLLAQYPKKKGNQKKVNIVLSSVNQESDLADFYNNSLLSSASAITQAFLSLGYTLYATQDKILKDVDAYYLLLPGSAYNNETIETTGFPGFAFKALKSGKPVFVQVAASVPDTLRWRQAMKELGFDSYKVEAVFDEGTESPIPLKAKSPFKEREVLPYRGYTFEPWNTTQVSSYGIGHSVVHPIQKSFETVLESPDGLPLITRKNKKFFVNGGYLHLAVAAVLANALAELEGRKPVYYSLSYGYFANTLRHTVFFAPYDTDIEVAVNGEIEKIDVFNEEGKPVKSSVVVEDGRLKGHLKKFNLLVIRKKQL